MKHAAPPGDVRSTRSRVLWFVGAIAIVPVVIGTMGLAASRASGSSASAGSAAADSVPVAAISVDVATTVPTISDFATPDDPVAVGVTTVTLTDPTRSTPGRGDTPASSERTLSVVVRYPTVGMPAADEIVDAPPLEPSPLVMFAHGFDASSETYAALLHDLAASGFVVASPEFPLSSSAYPGEPDESDIPEQARDMSFIISELTGVNAPAAVTDMIEPGPVGLVGHSDGAVTALLTAYSPEFADVRVGAVAAISGDFDTFGGNWFSTASAPLLAIHGEYDEINPFYSSELLVDNDPYAATLVGVAGASHLGAAIDPANTSAVARLIGNDFLWRLDGSEAGHQATLADANSSPLFLVTDHG